MISHFPSYAAPVEVFTGLNSAGIGQPPEGLAHRKIINQIVKDLDSELEEPDYQVKDEMILSVPEFTMTAEKLRQKINDMKSPDFWLQKGILCANEGKVEAAMDYYRQGLRLNPNSRELLYNLANSYKKLKRFNNSLRWFSHSVSLAPRWVDGLVGLATTFFNMHNYRQALIFIVKAVDNFKNQKT